MRNLQIKLCFRLDDPHARSDHSLERAILDVFSEFSIPLCAAIVPFYRGASSDEVVGACFENMPHIADAFRAGRIELAQHGCDHAALRRTLDGDPSEFAGVDEPTQTKLIVRGRRQLEEGFATAITGFVPPWNSYDGTTARVLANAGFRFISAGKKSPAFGARNKPVHGLVAVPRTCNMQSLEAAIQQAVHFRAAAPVVVCVLHPDEFVEFRDPPVPGDLAPFMSLKELKSKLAWCSGLKEIEVCSIGSLLEELGAVGRLLDVTDTWWFYGIPNRYRHRLPQLVLLRHPVGTLWPAMAGMRIRLRPS